MQWAFLEFYDTALAVWDGVFFLDCCAGETYGGDSVKEANFFPN